MENREASFVEYAVRVVFSMERLGDQRIFQESTLESAPFGTNSNYRRKLQVILLYIWYNERTHLVNDH